MAHNMVLTLTVLYNTWYGTDTNPSVQYIIWCWH